MEGSPGMDESAAESDISMGSSGTGKRGATEEQERKEETQEEKCWGLVMSYLQYLIAK